MRKPSILEKINWKVQTEILLKELEVERVLHMAPKTKK